MPPQEAGTALGRVDVDFARIADRSESVVTCCVRPTGWLEAPVTRLDGPVNCRIPKCRRWVQARFDAGR